MYRRLKPYFPDCRSVAVLCDLVHTPRCRNALIILYVERVPGLGLLFAPLHMLLQRRGMPGDYGHGYQTGPLVLVCQRHDYAFQSRRQKRRAYKAAIAALAVARV